MFIKLTRRLIFWRTSGPPTYMAEKLGAREVTTCSETLSSQGEHIISATSYFTHPPRQRVSAMLYELFYTCE